MRNVKNEVIPVKKRGNKNHLKIIQKISEDINLKHDIKEQKTATVGSVHILRKLLM